MGQPRTGCSIFLEDWDWCATAGIAPSIVTAPWLLADSARVAPRELSHRKKTNLMPTLGDWLNEVERVQLMLRLAPRLRQRYQDSRP